MIRSRTIAALLACLFVTGCAGTPTSSSSTPAVSVSPTTVAFPVTAIGSTAAASLTVSVVKDVALGVTSSNTAEFPFSTSCVVAMTAGSNCSVTVQFHPVVPGDHSALLVIASTSGNTAVILSGTATGVAQTPDRDSSFTLLLVTQQPNPFNLAPGQTTQLSAVAVSSAGGNLDVTAAATWISSDTSVATVSPAGLVRAVGAGNASISVSYRGQTRFIRVFVVQA